MKFYIDLFQQFGKLDLIIPPTQIIMKKILSLVALALFVSSAFGQGVDLSGKWKINREKSELGYEFSMAPNEVILEQGENSLSVERHSSFQGEEFSFTDKFTLDGEECENQGWMESIKKSKALWNEDNKVLVITSKIPMQDGGEMTLIEKYSLDGENLKIETSASSDYGDMSEVFVFDRQ